MNLQIKTKIKITINGPLTVLGAVPLLAQTIVRDANGECIAWREITRYPARKIYTLCRCGNSKNKPYCDGSHTITNFDGTETASNVPYLDQCESFIGQTLDLKDAKLFCAHAEFCDRAGGIWNLVSHSDNLANRKIAVEESCNCPSGRLVIYSKDGKVIEPAFEPSIAVMISSDGEFIGPIWVRGGVPIESVKGYTYEVRNRVTLCGCGKSSNKPFCDSSHIKQKPK